ncbi:FadR/GntR family transcriptional regulator [Planctomicrobium sp. SH661]|uniref:FadR/GntR family transcriptional regulator n=1 Tax=Planctomicrobium sp. SH661 TaxID=3448124 RepID=UPI003F5C65AF
MLKPIGKTKLRDVVANQLKRFILDGDLKPGDRLPTEVELAVSFGVSRLSLREATKSLEYLGIVESKPGRGLSVGSLNMDRVTECIGFHPALLGAAPDVLIGTRIALETGVLPYTCEAMKQDPAIYESLNAINTELRETRTLQRWVELDIRFHRELVQASGLTPLMPFTDVLAVFFRRFRESVQKKEWSQGVSSHQRIIDSLRDGNVADAVETLKAHVECHKGRTEALE